MASPSRPDASERRDPFGRSRGERLWRRLAGAGVAVTVATVIAAMLEVTLLPWVLFGAVVVQVLGVPSSWALGRLSRRTSHAAVVVRHLVAGAGLGTVVAAGLTLLGGERSWFPLWAAIAASTGMVVAVVAAWSALRLPSRWIRPVGIVGLLLTVVVLPVGTWLLERPPAPYDFVELTATSEVLDAFGSARGLATAIADGFEAEAAAGRDPTAHATWVRVAEEVTRGELGDHEAWVRFTADELLPRALSGDEPIRLVTVILRGQHASACVVVTRAAVDVRDEACRALELVD